MGGYRIQFLASDARCSTPLRTEARGVLWALVADRPAGETEAHMSALALGCGSILLLAAALFSGCASPPSANDPALLSGMDVAASLIGTWEGTVDIPADPVGPYRTFVVKSVERAERGWKVDATYGVPGRPYRADVNLVVPGRGRPQLGFQSSAGSRIELELESGGVLAGTLTTSNLRLRFPMALKRVGGGPPLRVVISAPADQDAPREREIELVGQVSSGVGITGVTVALNGEEVWTGPAGARSELNLRVPLTLRDGSNIAVVTATDSSGARSQGMRTLFYERPNAVAGSKIVPVPSRPNPTLWAVVIGVGEYKNPGIPKLRYSVSDAEAVYQVLTGLAGFKKEHVLLLTDRSEREPSYRNIKWALGTFLARSARKDDTVLIFFAGHGAPEIDQSGRERDGFAKYLVPSDADPEDLYSTGFPMDELLTVFSRLEAERVVAFLDTCYSGDTGGRTFTSKKTRTSSVDDLFLDRLTRSKGRAIVTASRATEVSLELAELGHGLFTYYLLQGLRGAADVNGDRFVSLQELYEYVEREVSAKSRQVGGNQHPVLKGEFEGAFPLIKVGGR